jgi:hypothetical protein
MEELIGQGPVPQPAGDQQSPTGRSAGLFFIDLPAPSPTS